MINKVITNKYPPREDILMEQNYVIKIINYNCFMLKYVSTRSFDTINIKVKISKIRNKIIDRNARTIN